jgi:hypothetical protein
MLKMPELAQRIASITAGFTLKKISLLRRIETPPRA